MGIQPEDPDKTVDAPAPELTHGVDAELISQGIFGPPIRPGLLGKIEQYDILRMLGEGGMGYVFLARDEHGVEVAIKTLRPELRHIEKARHRFQIEAQHILDLKHRHIVPILDLNAEATMPYFVMPYMSGGSLQQRITREGALATNEALSVVRDVATAVGFAHGRGVLHRDMKPSNVLLDEQGHAYLADFGLLRRFADESLVDASRPSKEGTPAYMSPMSAAGRSEDTRGDIYGLGAMLYEGLCGSPPYEGATTAELLTKITHGPPTPLSERCPKLSADVVAVVETAMARELRDRYAQVSDMVEDLQRVMDGQKPIGASVIRRTARKHMALLSVGLVALLVLLVGFMFWQRGEPQDTLAPTITYQLEEVGSFEVPGGVLADATIARWLAPDDTSVIVPSPNTVEAWSLDGVFIETIYETETPRIMLRGTGDFSGTNRDELVIAELLEGSGQEHLRIYSPTVGEFVSATNLVPAGSWDAPQVQLLGVGDCDNDGLPELLTTTFTRGAGGSYRGVIFYSLIDGELIQQPDSKTELLTVPTNSVTMDVDGDGDKDFVLGSYTNGPYDGHENTDPRWQPSVYALEGDGNELWSINAEELYRHLYPLPLTIEIYEQAGEKARFVVCFICTAKGPNATTELYCVVRGNPNPQYSPEVGVIYHLDPATGMPYAHYDAGSHISNVFPTDLDEDGIDELILTDLLGNLHILDASLSLIQRVNLVELSHERIMMTIPGWIAVGPENEELLVVTLQEREVISDDIAHYHHNRVLALNKDFDVVADYLVDESWDFSVRLRAQIFESEDTPANLVVYADRVITLNLTGVADAP